MTARRSCKSGYTPEDSDEWLSDTSNGDCPTCNDTTCATRPPSLSPKRPAYHTRLGITRKPTHTVETNYQGTDDARSSKRHLKHKVHRKITTKLSLEDRHEHVPSSTDHGNKSRRPEDDCHCHISNAHIHIPTDVKWQARMCSQLDVTLKREVSLPFPKHPVVLREQVPEAVYPVAGDGNCLFRCLSLLITGTEKHHHHIRTIIVEHMCSHPRNFSSLMPKWSQEDVAYYVKKSRMHIRGTWGSDIEIMAAAHLLKTRIYVFTRCGLSWQWALHDTRLTAQRSRPVKESIYLLHEGLVHYNVVESIGHKEAVLNSQSISSKSSSSRRRRPTSPNVVVEETCGECEERRKLGRKSTPSSRRRRL